MAKSIEQLAAELTDRESIRELPLKYCDCVWRSDSTGIVDLFTNDGEFITKGFKTEQKATGRDGLMKLYGGLGQGELAPRPYIHNHVIDLKGNGRASGRCYVEIRNFKKNLEWVGAGYYDDEYVKVGDGWKFQSRLFHPISFAVNP